MTEPDFIGDHARTLLKAGEVDRAVTYMTRFALNGDVEAMIALAHHENEQGQREKSDAWIERAEDELRPDDHDARVDLLFAYQLGLGSVDHKVRESRAIELLGELADSGNIVAAHTLMTYYLYGLNGADVSRDKFEHWARIATSLGSESAATALGNIERWPNVAP